MGKRILSIYLEGHLKRGKKYLILHKMCVFLVYPNPKSESQKSFKKIPKHSFSKSNHVFIEIILKMQF